MTGTTTASASLELHDPEHRHRDVRGGSARAAVFGISDGLVSNASLVLGIDGAHPAAAVVRLAGLAGLLGGALSMAAGEYVSMRAQAELFERELDVERSEIHRYPDGERRELALIYERRGVAHDVAEDLAAQMMATPDRALETHAREELGIDPGELGSPVAAALASLASFAAGAFVPLVAFLVLAGSTATLLAVGLSAVAATAVGVALALFTGRPWWMSGLRQLGLCSAAAAVTFGVGAAVGHSGGI
ncbi:MAG: VIT1/CCC1 transporter family protein [Acidimicrobiales bacterium]